MFWRRTTSGGMALSIANCVLMTLLVALGLASQCMPACLFMYEEADADDDDLGKAKRALVLPALPLLPAASLELVDSPLPLGLAPLPPSPRERKPLPMERDLRSVPEPS